MKRTTRLILATVIASTMVHGFDMGAGGFNAEAFINKAKRLAKKYVKDEGTKYAEDQAMSLAPKRTVQGGTTRLTFPLKTHLIFNNKNCNKVIKRDAFTSCYDYDKKGSRLLFYTLRGDDLRSGYIQRKEYGNPFYADNAIPEAFRAYPYDFSHSGQDKGHIRSYASSAYSQKLINQTYSMVNVLPQTPDLNRNAWLGAEKYERYTARKVGTVGVLNIAMYEKPVKRIGRHKVAVPSGFYKIVTDASGEPLRCFYYPNVKRQSSSLRDHIVDCDKIRY